MQFCIEAKKLLFCVKELPMITHTKEHPMNSYIFSLLHHIFTKKENQEVQNFCWMSFNQLLAPPFALSHTYKKASCKAACIRLTTLIQKVLMLKCVQ